MDSVARRVGTSAIPALAMAAAYGLAALPLLAHIGHTAPPPLDLWPTLLLGGVLVAASAFDWACYRLPDALTMPLIAAGVVLALPAGLDAALGRAAGAAAVLAAMAGLAWAYRRRRGRDGLGLGDAKLAAAAAAWLGAAAVPAVLLVATAGALTMVAISRAAGHPVGWQTRIPFGPFLAFAIWLVWLYRDLLGPGTM